MAARTTTELVCDLCGETRGVRRWRIELAGDNRRRASPDLCKEHSAVLDEVLKKFPAGTGRRPRRRQVLTEAQIRAKRVKKDA